MMSVARARHIMTSHTARTSIETVVLSEAIGRVLAKDVIAPRAQPVRNLSAMDGYAVRSCDVAMAGSQLSVIGVSPAGGEFDGVVSSGQAVRIFTGAPVPNGADRIVIQENTIRADNNLVVPEPQTEGVNIRTAGLDYKKGTTVLTARSVITAERLALAAAVNQAILSVIRKPKVLILASGDELIEPGGELTPFSITNSGSYGVLGLIQTWGGDGYIGGILPDEMEPCLALLEELNLGSYDLIVTIGGASVGDRDIVKPVMRHLGANIMFEKIAVKPGKPCWYAHIEEGTSIIGLPGNPASALVCAHLFIRSWIKHYLGQSSEPQLLKAIVTDDIEVNGPRETYLRAYVDHNLAEESKITISPRQDSSLLTPFAHANALALRLPDAPILKAGEKIYYIGIASSS